MSRVVGCSDASLDGGGGCVADISPEEVLELSRFRERWRFKGDRALINPRTQALAADPPGLLPSSSSGVRVVPFVGGRLLDTNWRTIFSDPWAFSEHVTTLEARAALKCLCYLLRTTRTGGMTHVLIVDSMAACLGPFSQLSSWSCSSGSAYGIPHPGAGFLLGVAMGAFGAQPRG